MSTRLLALALVALLLGCNAEMTAPQGSFSINPTSAPMVAAGEQLALSCLQREGIAIMGDIDAYSLWIVPGASMDSDGNASAGHDLPNAGVTDFNARRVYIVQLYAGDRRAWAHEFLHVLTGAREHPPFFRACGLSGVRTRQ